MTDRYENENCTCEWHPVLQLGTLIDHWVCVPDEQCSKHRGSPVLFADADRIDRASYVDRLLEESFGPDGDKTEGFSAISSTFTDEHFPKIVYRMGRSEDDNIVVDVVEFSLEEWEQMRHDFDLAGPKKIETYPKKIGKKLRNLWKKVAKS